MTDPPARGGHLLVLYDSELPGSLALAETAVLAALRHLHAPFTELDLAAAPLAAGLAADPAAVVIASPHALARLTARETADLLDHVRQGAGLVDFAAAPPPELLPAPAGWREVSQAVTADLPGHYCLATRPAGRADALRQPLRCPVLQPPPGWDILLTGDQGQPLLLAGRLGQGRVVQWALPLDVWTFDYLGHAAGLDDLFWRGLVWAARKPFAMLCMPPFVTARIDDASGSGSTYHHGPQGAAHRFAYVDIMNRHGFRPNVGLFIRDIPAGDDPELRRLVEAGLLEVSPHAFTEINDHPDHLIYMTHDGREYSDAELDRNFAEVDAFFERVGVRPAATLNCHYYEMGERSLPYLQARGWRFLMTEIRAGCTYTDPRARDWFPPPYGHFGYILAPLVDHPEFFDCLAQYNGPAGKDAGASDCLHRFTTFWQEGPRNDPPAAGAKIAAMVGRGLDNVFFGSLMTHEQRIASLTREEWERALAVAQAALAAYEQLPARYSEVSRYAERWARTTLLSATVHPHGLECRLAGPEANMLLSVFEEEDGAITRRLLPVRTGPQPVWVEM